MVQVLKPNGTETTNVVEDIELTNAVNILDNKISILSDSTVKGIFQNDEIHYPDGDGIVDLPDSGGGTDLSFQDTESGWEVFSPVGLVFSHQDKGSGEPSGVQSVTGPEEIVTGDDVNVVLTHDSTKIDSSSIVDNIITDDPASPLSAKQGTVLKSFIDGEVSRAESAEEGIVSSLNDKMDKVATVPIPDRIAIIDEFGQAQVSNTSLPDILTEISAAEEAAINTAVTTSKNYTDEQNSFDLYKVSRTDWDNLTPEAQLALANQYRSIYIDEGADAGTLIANDPSTSDPTKVFPTTVINVKFQDVISEINGLRSGNRYTNNFGKILDPTTQDDQNLLTAFALTKQDPVPDGMNVLNTFPGGGNFQWYENDSSWFALSQTIGVASDTAIGAVLSSEENLHINVDATIGDMSLNATSEQVNAINSGVTADVVSQVNTNTSNISTLVSDVMAKYTKPASGIPSSDLEVLYQPAITTTGNTNVLLAPVSLGANPTGKALNTLLAAPDAQTANTQILLAPATKGNAPTLKAVSDLLASPAAQSTNQVLLAPATKGNAPTLKALSDFVLKADLPDVAFIGTQYSAVSLATLNAAANKVITGNFNGSGMTYNPWVAVKRSATQWDWMGVQNGHCENGSITSAGMTRSSIARTSLTSKGAIWSLQRTGNVVTCSVFNRATTSSTNGWATLVTLPEGYRPYINTINEDSLWIFCTLNHVHNRFQMFSDGTLRCPDAVPSGTEIFVSASWITDNSYPMTTA